MSKKWLLLSVLTLAGHGIASADTLRISVSGQFSSSDTAGPLVAPNGLFSVNFLVNSNQTPVSGTVTGIGFDVPASGFSYTLNNSPVSATPSEIRFNTLANGGLFDVIFGSGLNAQEFDFQGVQGFTGSTAAPIFSAGTFAVSSWTYSDPAGNFDVRTPISSAVSVAAVPEPSFMILILAGLMAISAVKLYNSPRVG